MNRFYKKLYQFRIQHEFYTNLASTDFTIYPTKEAAKWLKSYGVIVKTETDGFDLAYRKESDPGNDPFIDIDESNYLPFVIEVKNEGILNLTDPPPKSNSTDIYIASGDYTDAALTFLTIPTRQPQFTEQYTYTFERVTFRIEDIDGNTLIETSQNGFEDPDIPANYNFAFSVNLSAEFEQGRYKLKTFSNGILQDELEVYLYNRMVYPNLYGVFELELDENIDYNILPYEAVLSLSAFENEWTYSVEITRLFLAASLTLKDTAAISPVAFTMDPGVPTFAVGEIITFTSTTDIKKTELPITTFQLELTSTDVNFTLEKLPNPTHANQNSIVYLKI